MADPKLSKEMEEALKSHEKWKAKHQLKWGFIVSGIMAVIVFIVYLVMMTRMGFWSF